VCFLCSLCYQLLTCLSFSYIPGWDCHGLPIENKALQELGVQLQSLFRCHTHDSLQKDSRALPATNVREAARKTAEGAVVDQKDQFIKFGIMADWSEGSTYRTLGTSIISCDADMSLMTPCRPRIRDAPTCYLQDHGGERRVS
jgi:isoleucyl-tRNA synthetase